MDNPVYLDEDIPFVESGDYEIDDATGGSNGTTTTTTTLGHGNIISLNHHQTHTFHNDSLWTSNVSGKRGRRPKSTAVVITTTASAKSEPKRRGRKPRQDASLSITRNTSNDLLLDTNDTMSHKQQRRTGGSGMKSNKKIKLEEQQHVPGKCLLREKTKQ
jgi:hypothetical protein